MEQIIRQFGGEREKVKMGAIIGFEWDNICLFLCVCMVDRNIQCVSVDSASLIIYPEIKLQRYRFKAENATSCLLYTSPSPRDLSTSRMPSSA